MKKESFSHRARGVTLLSPSWRVAGSSEHSQQTHQTTHTVSGSLDRLQRVLDTWTCSLCVPGICPGQGATPLRTVGEDTSWAPSWAPGGSVASSSAETGALSAPCPWGQPGQLWGGLKEASLLMKATMVSSRNNVKVGLEMRKHSDKPTDVRFIEGLEMLPYELTSGKITTRASPERAGSPTRRPQRRSLAESLVLSKGTPLAPEDRFQPWGISEKSCVTAARCLSLSVPQHGIEESICLEQCSVYKQCCTHSLNKHRKSCTL